MTTSARVVYTIGHSDHSLERLIELLQKHNVTAVADVRSQPYSRRVPHFNREAIKEGLRDRGIADVFLGGELGGRSDEPSTQIDGRVEYDRVAESDLFQKGLDRVEEGAQKYRLTLMCAEKDPLTCHRAILVARHLDHRGIEVRHILADGRIETQAELSQRLLRERRLDQPDLFAGPDQLLRRAFKLQEERISYERPESDEETELANKENPG